MLCYAALCGAVLRYGACKVHLLAEASCVFSLRLDGLRDALLHGGSDNQIQTYQTGTMKLCDGVPTWCAGGVLGQLRRVAGPESDQVAAEQGR